MTQAKHIVFRPYTATDEDVCLSIFDANCPEFFAPSERDDYASFLAADTEGYEICVVDELVAGAFGLVGESGRTMSLNWILLSPQSHGLGVGSAIMHRVVDLGRASGLRMVSIAASHKSAPFFAKFGAVETEVTNNGWGPGMDRVDMELHL